jgi:LysR family glycine cleavage system transcriptional activator
MSDPVPPFSALRALEAASRHRSFTRAAQELNITHSAVSQSIKRLEGELGARLFERRGGAMEPSDAALRLAQSYFDAAQSLGQAIREISGQGAEQSLTLGLPADVARLWLAGRIGRLTEALPDVRVEVLTASQGRTRDVELTLDRAARSGDQVLCDLAVFPVCAPGYAAGRGLTRIGAIAGAPLLGAPDLGWRGWIQHYAPGVEINEAHVFDDVGVALEAAAQGGGVALAHILVAEPFLVSGQLQVLPFAAPGDLQFLFRARTVSEPVSRLFMWLKLEVGRSLALLRGRLEP